jgi:hypothetical protein
LAEAPARRAWRRPADEAGTILLMVPAGLLVIIMLGAMAFDLSLSYAGERRIADLASSWANDALAELNFAEFYAQDGDLTDGESVQQKVAIDQVRARASVNRSLASMDEPGLLNLAVVVSFPDELTIEVVVSADVPLLFLDAVPGVHSRQIATTSRASLVVTG